MPRLPLPALLLASVMAASYASPAHAATDPQCYDLYVTTTRMTPLASFCPFTR